MKRTYLYELNGTTIYLQPNWTSKLAIMNLAYTLNRLYPETGHLYGIWEIGKAEAKKRGISIADRLPSDEREYINASRLFTAKL